MKSLFLETPLPASARKIGYNDRLLLHGSCFTEHIGNRLQQTRFEAVTNPFGTVFNPIIQCEQLMRAVDEEYLGLDDLLCRDEQWLSWMHHSRFSASEPEILLQQLNGQLQQTRQLLLNATVLVLTFGTARCYKHLERNTMVANCHKMPAAQFQAGFSAPDDIAQAIFQFELKLRSINPNLNILFTVSPVRYHSNDPLENSVGKGNIFAALSIIREQLNPFWYFPAYEMVTDQLRDYRFYADDLKHPSEKAIDFVWQQFKNWALEPTEAIALAEQLHQRKSHRPVYPQSKSHQQFEQETVALEHRWENLVKRNS
jgi:hypothetical protein